MQSRVNWTRHEKRWIGPPQRYPTSEQQTRERERESQSQGNEAQVERTLLRDTQHAAGVSADSE